MKILRGSLEGSRVYAINMVSGKSLEIELMSREEATEKDEKGFKWALIDVQLKEDILVWCLADLDSDNSRASTYKIRKQNIGLARES